MFLKINTVQRCVINKRLISREIVKLEPLFSGVWVFNPINFTMALTLKKSISRVFLFQQAVFNGITCKSGKISYFKLGNQVFSVTFYGMLAQEKFLSYFIGSKFLGN